MLGGTFIHHKNVVHRLYRCHVHDAETRTHVQLLNRGQFHQQGFGSGSPLAIFYTAFASMKSAYETAHSKII